jgi:hypothetical protein
MGSIETGFKTTDIGNIFVTYSDFVAAQPVATLTVSGTTTTTTSKAPTPTNFYYGKVHFFGSYTNTDNIMLLVKDNTAVSLTISASPNTQVNSNLNLSNDLVYTAGMYQLASTTDGSYNATTIIITINDIYETATTLNVVGQNWLLSNYWYNSGYMNLSTTTSGGKTTFPGGLSLALANNIQAYSNFWSDDTVVGTYPAAGVNFTNKQCVFPNTTISSAYTYLGGGGCDLDRYGNNLYTSVAYSVFGSGSFVTNYVSIYNLPTIRQYNDNLSTSDNVLTSLIFNVNIQNTGSLNSASVTTYSWSQGVKSLYPLSVTTNAGAVYAVTTSNFYNNNGSNEWSSNFGFYPVIIYIYGLTKVLNNFAGQSYVPTIGVDSSANASNCALMCLGSLAEANPLSTTGATYVFNPTIPPVVNTGISLDGYHGIVFFQTKVYNISYDTASSSVPVWVQSTFFLTLATLISGSLSQSSATAMCIDISGNTPYVYWSTDYGVTFNNIPTPTDSLSTYALTIANCQSCAISPDGLQVIITTIMINNSSESWTGTYNTTAGTFTWVYTTLSTNGINFSISNVTFDKNSISTTMEAVGYSPEFSRFVTTSSSPIIPLSNTSSI